MDNLKVLIIDDSIVAREISAAACKGMDIKNIVEAEDGKVGLEKLKELSDIGLILCDHNMPIMTGLEFLIEIKKDDNFKTIPFIFITSEGEESFVIEALSAGADEYLTKPFEEDEFKEKIMKCLKG